MGVKRIVLILCILQTSACSASNAVTQEELYFKNLALSICLGAAFDHDEVVRSDFNKAANGYMEKGNMPIEAIEEIRGRVDEWLEKDYRSKQGGQVNSAKCFDFRNSQELADVFNNHDPCSSRAAWLDDEDFKASCRTD